MRLAGILSAALLGGLVLLSLFTRSLDWNTHRYDQALDALDALELADTNIDNDVLKARVGLLRNYDTLVAGDSRARVTLEALRRLPRSEPQLSQSISALQADYAAKSAQLELFKSQNALLSNSLTYFWRESGSQILDARDPAPARTANVLASAIHRLSLDTTGDAVAQARARLDAASATDPTAPLLLHGRMLLRLLPETDATIRRMRPISSLTSYSQTKQYLQERQAALQAKAQQVRMLLLALAIVMLSALLYLGVMLRHRARVLRRRAEFDRLMVSVSRELVASEQRRLDAGIGAGLSRLAQWTGVPQAGLGLVPAGGAARIWPDPEDDGLRAVVVDAAAAARSAAPSEILVMDANSIVGALARPTRAHLRDVRWLCLRQRSEGGTVALLCFRLLRSSRRRNLHAGEHCEDLPQLYFALDTLFDALERRRLEEEAQALQRRLAVARRMETLGTMASGISHNFNNIVGAIRGNAEAAIAKLGSRSSARENLVQITRATSHAYDLIEAILGFGRVQNYSVQRVELHTLLQGTVSLLAVSLPSTIALDVRQDPGALHLLGNPAQLQQVILNLATNAAQAMAMHGTVSISLGAAWDSDLDGASRRIATLTVEDSGVGIPADRLDRIFEPFFTTRDGGTGLGLATVQKIVENHAGNIRVHSRVNVGTTFLVELPLCTREHAESESIGEQEGGHATLLVLCDAAVDLERLEEMLAALGHEPVGQLDPAAAVSMLSTDVARFDALLVERDRVGDAEAAIGALHQAAPHLPVILSTRAGNLSISPGLGSAISEIVAQPFEMGALALALKRALARSRGTHNAG